MASYPTESEKHREQIATVEFEDQDDIEMSDEQIRYIEQQYEIECKKAIIDADNYYNLYGPCYQNADDRDYYDGGYQSDENDNARYWQFTANDL